MGRYAQEPANATKSCKVRRPWRQDGLSPTFISSGGFSWNAAEMAAQSGAEASAAGGGAVVVSLGMLRRQMHSRLGTAWLSYCGLHQRSTYSKHKIY